VVNPHPKNELNLFGYLATIHKFSHRRYKPTC